MKYQAGVCHHRQLCVFTCVGCWIVSTSRAASWLMVISVQCPLHPPIIYFFGCYVAVTWIPLLMLAPSCLLFHLNPHCCLCSEVVTSAWRASKSLIVLKTLCVPAAVTWYPINSSTILSIKPSLAFTDTIACNCCLVWSSDTSFKHRCIMISDFSSVSWVRASVANVTWDNEIFNLCFHSLRFPQIPF